MENSIDLKRVNIFKSFVLLDQDLPGCVGKSVTCQTANPGVASLFAARSHTSVEIDHEIISTSILLPSADSRRVVVSYKLCMCTYYWLTAYSSLPRK